MSVDSKFTHGLARIDVRLGTYEESDFETLWQVTLRQVHAVNAEVPAILMQGYLRCRMADGMGQALSVGVLPERKLIDVIEGDELEAEFVQFANNYLVETLYDQARRALESQAAAMDFSFKLDVECPETAYILPHYESEDDQE